MGPLFTGIAVMIIPSAIVKIRQTIRKLKNLRLVRFLEEKLRPAGYQVWHDIQADDFNVDHVLMGPGGIFTIETRTHRKPEKGPCEIVYFGNAPSLAIPGIVG